MSSVNLNSESCLLTLNYAWFHVIGCTLQLGLLYYGFDNTQFFTEAHSFGIFAMLADYGHMHLIKGTRTIQGMVPEGMERGDVDDLTGFGIFFFFLWFDYWGAFALIVFARHVGNSIHQKRLSKASTFCIIFQAVMWWTAPPFSHVLKWDNRQVLLTRESPKLTYLIMLVLFSVLLKFHHKISARHYISILLSGLACGSLHHLALFVHGMRGYDSIGHLCLTLATEWPALLFAEDYIRNSFHSNRHLERYKQVVSRSMIVLIVAMMLPHAPTDEQLTEFLITYLPGHIMQAFGTAFFRIKTCILPSLLFTSSPQLVCRDDDDDNLVWILSTTSKSGAVLSAKLLLDIATLCGYCVASGSRDRPGIPEIVHAPTYPGQLVHAADMTMEWPKYVADKPHKCIVITRDPLRRLRSYYTYTRSGGEHWVRYETDFMHSLRTAPSLEESVERFWNRKGKEYLVASHEMFQKEILEHGCLEIRMEDLTTNNMKANLRQMLNVFQVSEPAVEPLVERMLRHDRTKTDPTLLSKDAHVSSKKFSADFLARVDTILSDKHPEISVMIATQRKEMEEWRQRINGSV